MLHHRSVSYKSDSVDLIYIGFTQKLHFALHSKANTSSVKSVDVANAFYFP